MFKSISRWDHASLSILWKSVISGPLPHAGAHPNENRKKKKNYLIINTLKLNNYKKINYPYNRPYFKHAMVSYVDKSKGLCMTDSSLSV